MDEVPGGARPVVAVVGLGEIGGAIARHLLVADVDLAVFDVREEAMEEFTSGGARAASSPADVADGADVVLVAVVTDAQVRDVMTSRVGTLATAKPGSVVVIHSTVRLSTVRDLSATATGRGVHVLDAGVSTGGGDESGSLAIFVGGDPDGFASVQPVLAAYSHALEHVGPLGSGMAAKLARNLLGFSMMAAAYESMALAEAAGVDLEIFRRILGESDATASADLVLAYPTTRPVSESEAANNFAEQLTGRRGAAFESALAGYVAIIEKDIDNALALADDAGYELLVAGVTRRLVRPFLLLPGDGDASDPS